MRRRRCVRSGCRIRARWSATRSRACRASCYLRTRSCTRSTRSAWSPRIYASVIDLAFARTATRLSGIVNGIGTIAFALFIDPTTALIVDRPCTASAPGGTSRAMIFWLVGHGVHRHAARAADPLSRRRSVHRCGGAPLVHGNIDDADASWCVVSLWLCLALRCSATTGCASSVAALDRRRRATTRATSRSRTATMPTRRSPTSSRCRVEPANAHARAGLVAVQARIAQTLFAGLEVRGRGRRRSTWPRGTRRATSASTRLRPQIEQAEIKRDIVVSNYPSYRETGDGDPAFSSTCASASKQIAVRCAVSTTPTTAPTSPPRSGRATSSTKRSAPHEPAVALPPARRSGVPENADAAAVAPPASLLPLP